MTTILLILVLTALFALLVSYARHDHFAGPANPPTTTTSSARSRSVATSSPAPDAPDPVRHERSRITHAVPRRHGLAGRRIPGGPSARSRRDAAPRPAPRTGAVRPRRQRTASRGPSRFRPNAASDSGVRGDHATTRRGATALELGPDRRLLAQRPRQRSEHDDPVGTAGQVDVGRGPHPAVDVERGRRSRPAATRSARRSSPRSRTTRSTPEVDVNTVNSPLSASTAVTRRSRSGHPWTGSRERIDSLAVDAAGLVRSPCHPSDAGQLVRAAAGQQVGRDAA